MSNTLTPAGDGHTLLVICIVMLILGWTTVATRLYVRCKHKTLGIDDWLMVAGLVCSSYASYRNDAKAMPDTLILDNGLYHRFLLPWRWLSICRYSS